MGTGCRLFGKRLPLASSRRRLCRKLRCSSLTLSQTAAFVVNNLNGEQIIFLTTTAARHVLFTTGHAARDEPSDDGSL